MKRIYLIAISLTIFSLSFGLPNLIKKDSVATEPEKKTSTPKKTSPPKKPGRYVLKSTEKVVVENEDTYLMAPGITATKTVAVNGGGNALPGSQLNYSILLSNSGTDATGVILTDVLVNDLTLVAGSVKATPIGVDETYQAIGNAGINVTAANGLLANDISPDNSALTVTAATVTGTNGGTFTIATDGGFSYINNPGFTGNDTYTYTINTANGKTNTAIVTISISNTIWFIDVNYAGGSSNGTITRPFTTINAFQTINDGANTNRGENGDNIFVYSGTYSTSALTLRNSQKLIGKDVSSSILTILGISLPTYSNSLPTTGGLTVTIANTTVTPITLGSDNDIQGCTITSSTGTTMSGASIGALKVRETVLSASAGQALQITAGGALDVQFKSISATGATKGISVNNSTGSFQILGTSTTAGSGGTINNITARGVEFVTCANVTLKNMNFTSANTLDGTLTDTDNNAANAAIHGKAVSGLTLNNIAVSGTTAQVGLNLATCSNVSISSSSFANCGTLGSSNEGGIVAKNLSGTCSIANTSITTSGGRNAYIRNDNATVLTSLTVSNSTFNTANTASNFFFEGNDTSNSSLIFKTNTFTNPTTHALDINANGSCTINAQIGGSNVSEGNSVVAKTSVPGSDGIFIQGSGSPTVNYNVINNNVQTSFNGYFPINIGGQGTAGQFTGRINNNTTSISNAQVPTSGMGIFVGAYGRVKHIVEIKNNQINNAGNYGIQAETNDNITPSADGTIDVTIQNNTVNMISGGSAYAHYGLTANNYGTSSATMVTCANTSGNISNNVTVTKNLELSSNVIGIPSSRSVIKIQGNYGSLPGAWTTPNASGGSVAIDTQGGGTTTLSGAFTCLTPTNPAAVRMIASTTEIENTENIAVKEEGNIVNNPTDELVVLKNKIDTKLPVETISTFSFNNSLASNNSAEIITLNGSGSGFSLPAGKSTTITFSATVASTPSTCLISNQATISGSNFTSILSDDPAVVGTANITNTNLVVPAQPTGVSASQNAICSGTSISLSATCASSTINWYNSASGGNALGTGNAFSQSPTVNTTYYASCEYGSCSSSRVATSQVVVTSIPSSPTGVSASQNAICNGTSVSLSATCASGTINWYNAASAGTVLGTGNTFSQSPTVNTTFYASCENGSCRSNRVATGQVVVTSIPNSPTGISASQTAICSGTSISLSATCASGTINWYNAATGGNALGTGNAFSQSPTVNTTYYASCEYGTCSSSRVATSQVVVTNQPTEVSANQTAICSGTSISLSAICTSGTINWYNAASGGTVLGTGNAFSQSPTINTIYFASCENGSCSSSRVATSQVVVTSIPNSPTGISASQTAICSGTSISLSATCASGTINWYNAATGGNALGTGNAFAQSPTVNTTFYASCENISCKSNRVATSQVVVTTLPSLPTSVSASQTAICSGTSISLSATCSSGTINWYNSATAGTLLGTGNTFAQSPTLNSTYYASCENGSCRSSRVATSLVLVNPQTINLTTDISNGTVIIPAIQTITATNKIISPAKVIYRAGNAIFLNTGFEAQNGTTFIAQIGGCN